MRVCNIVLLSGLIAVAPLAADDVFLKNGRVFEDVISRVEGDQVRIRMAFGEMAFPLDAIERIKPGESSLVAYESRRDALRDDPTSGAPDWIELARDAERQGNRHSAREATLVAAALDPHAPELAPLMRAMDYVFDSGTGRWISFEESMRRKGFTLVEGQWMSPEQLQARTQAAIEAARAREAEQESRLTRAVLAMAAAELAKEPEPVEPNPEWAWPVAVFPQPFKWRYPNPFKGTHRATPYRASPYRGGSDHLAIPIERRQPGSLFPIASKPTVGPGTTRSSSVVLHDGSN